jgi:hypothetical protein
VRFSLHHHLLNPFTHRVCMIEPGLPFILTDLNAQSGSVNRAVELE